MTRRTRLMAVCAGAAVAGAVAWTGITGIMDTLELRNLCAQVESAAAGSGELSAPREALERIAELDRQPLLRHIWIRTLGAGTRADAVSAIERALGSAEHRAVQRAAGQRWAEGLRSRLEQAATLPELSSVTALVAAGPAAGTAIVSTQASAELQALAQQLAERFAEDDRLNAQAVEALRSELESAGGDAAALQRAMDRVLPRPDRQPALRGMAVESLHAEANSRRVVALIERIRAYETAVRAAPDAVGARAQLAALEADPQLRRAVPPSVGLESARARMRALVDGLGSWERGMALVESRLADNDPVGAAHALGSLKATDPQRARMLGELRGGFGDRMAVAIAKALVLMAEQGDWNGAWTLAACLHCDGVVTALLDEGSRIALGRSERAMEAVEDRMLYEDLRASPRVELAQRYMEGWPGVARRMAPAVAEYLAWCQHPATELTLEAAEWRELGAPASAIPDMPDATIEIKIDGISRVLTRIEDIVEGTRTTLIQPLTVPLADGDSQQVTIEAIVTIDLRDTVNDPVATGRAVAYPADLRALRSITLPVLDASVSSRPHRLILKASGAGAPVLPPWDAASTAQPR